MIVLRRVLRSEKSGRWSGLARDFAGPFALGEAGGNCVLGRPHMCNSQSLIFAEREGSPTLRPPPTVDVFARMGSGMRLDTGAGSAGEEGLMSRLQA